MTTVGDYWVTGDTGHGVPPEQQLVDGILRQVVGVVAVGMTARDAEDPLSDQLRERVPNLLRRALVGETPGKRLDEAVHALGCLEQDGPAVGTRLLAVERRDEGLSKRSGNRTVCDIVSGVMQGSPLWLKALVNTTFIPHHCCPTDFQMKAA